MQKLSVVAVRAVHVSLCLRDVQLGAATGLKHNDPDHDMYMHARCNEFE